MNVLLVVPWDQEFGGVASVVGNLGRHLSNAGHHVVFFHPGESRRLRPKATAWGFSGYELNIRTPLVTSRPVRSRVAFIVSLLPTLYRLRRLIRRERIQAVNVHYPIEAFCVFGMLRWLLPIKLVVSIHGADVFPEGRQLGRYRWPLHLLLSAADAVVMPSRAFLQDVVRTFPKAAGKALFIHNGIDLRELLGAEEGPAASHGHYLLCIATHDSKKAVDVLLRAFVTIGQTARTLRLVLVGDGPLREELEQLTRNLGLQDRVTFLGWRGRREVIRLLRDCDLFVLPSRSEPFGIVVAEALASQKAVVASAVGGIPEIIEDGISGVLVTPDDPIALAAAVLTLLDDDARRDALGRAGHKRIVERFSHEATGSRYEDLFGRVMRDESPLRDSA
jgi:glycosyltransferase involved in cell wall biosynthesis